jgi:hypothetical protein
MSRAARLLAGATLVGVSACSSTTQRNVAPPYGTPPRLDAGVVDRDGAGGADGAGGTAGSDGATGTTDAPSNDAAED